MNNGIRKKFHELRQTPEEAPKRCGNNNKDEGNILKNLDIDNWA